MSKMSKEENWGSRRPLLRFYGVVFGSLIVTSVSCALIADADFEIIKQILTGLLLAAVFPVGWTCFAPLKWVVGSERKVQATFVGRGSFKHSSKSSKYAMYHLTFRSADGSKYKLDCSKKTYHLLRKNTCGELSYRELFGNNLSFIGFVSTGEQASVRASAKRRTSKKPVVIRGGIKQISVPRLLLQCVLGFWGALLVLVAVGSQSSSRFFSLLFAGAAAFLGVVLLSANRLKWKTIPEQQMTAVVVGNKIRENKLYVTFSFEDGAEKRVRVPDEAYVALAYGDSGVLTFKERKEEAVFIAFEYVG